MEFEWDKVKAQSNQLKHGVSFLEATEVFADPYSAGVHDPDHAQDEDRYLLLGLSLKGSYIVVSLTERADSIRIISARPMTRRERKADE
ncbi:BrnT family toxin [Spirulina major]|uniref:BrnT family toxin n=1 Tax=Spirulina major TaxID=270636 RepID=UPI000932CB8C|nr:BrnT family toxin [Spirulina major]